MYSVIDRVSIVQSLEEILLGNCMAGVYKNCANFVRADYARNMLYIYGLLNVRGCKPTELPPIPSLPSPRSAPNTEWLEYST